MNNRKYLFAGASVIFCVWSFFGCGGEETDAQKDASVQVTPGKTEVRLNEEEKDTLRSWARRFDITWEEYWEGKGGVLANQHFEMWYPAGPKTFTHAMFAFRILFETRQRARDIFGTVPDWPLEVNLTSDFDEFKKCCNGEWWNYSRTEGNKMTLQPIMVMYQRGIIEQAISREFFEWVGESLSRNKAPRWITEGLASFLVEEKAILEDQLNEFPQDDPKLDLDTISKHLQEQTDRKWTRVATYNAFRMVEELISVYGRQAVIDVILLFGEGKRKDDAFLQAFGAGYDEVIANALDFTVEKSGGNGE